MRPGGVALAFVLLTSACATSSGPRPTVTVGSFNFTESRILAEIYAQALETAGYPVERKSDLGEREVVAPALAAGEIDLLPEYTGSALQITYGVEPPADPQEAYDLLVEAVEGGSVVALDYARAEDKNVFAVRREFAEQHGLESLSDLAEVPGRLVLGGAPECEHRDTCYRGLVGTYGLDRLAFKPLDVAGEVTVEALRSGEVDVVLLFSTHPATADAGVVVLEDDRGVVGAENVVPLVHTDIIEAYGDAFRSLVDEVSDALTTEALLELNRRVGAGEEPAAVARSFLEDQDLLDRAA